MAAWLGLGKVYLLARTRFGYAFAVSVVLAACTDSGWAVAAGFGRTWFMTSWRAKLLARLSGVALIGGGIWLSLARRPA